MLGIQGVYFAARLQNSCGQYSIVDVSSIARIPFAIECPDRIDDLLIDRRGLKLRQE
jgi:hypothetical protein